MISVCASAIHHTTEFGDFEIHLVKNTDNPGMEHVVLTRGDLYEGTSITCRVSSECLPGTALFSAECDCKEQIRFSLEKIATENRGIFIYLRQEGRGHGLQTKIQALMRKNMGMNTFEAVEALGLPVDVREYGIVNEILNFFKIKSITLITNSPEKTAALRDNNILIDEIINIPITPNPVSQRHLEAKRQRGHRIDFQRDKQRKI